MNPDPELLRWTDWIPVIQSVFMFLTVVCSAITVIVAVSKQKTDKESSVKAIEKAEEQARKRAIIDLLIAQKKRSKLHKRFENSQSVEKRQLFLPRQRNKFSR